MNNKLIKDKTSQDKGFTLVEIMIALMIFSMIMTALSHVFIRSVESNVHAQKLTEATALLTSEIALLKGLPIAQVVGDVAVTPNGGFWTQRVIIEDQPSPQDANGNTVSRVVEIRVYESAAYAAIDRRIASCSFVKVENEKL